MNVYFGLKVMNLAHEKAEPVLPLACVDYQSK